MAEDTLALMDQLNIDSAVAVGWSDGGVVGLDLAIHHPDRLRKLTVSGTNFRVSGHEAEALEAGTIEWLLTTSPDKLAPGLQRTYERLSPDGPAHWPIFIERLRKMWAADPGYTSVQLAGIKIPTLVMIGDKDLVRPEHAVEAFRAIPGAQLCVFPHAGHAVPQVHPRLWNEAVLTFLNEPEAIEHR
jgi:pimeloyl-ACP methyl ester carboxylesterase